jgi:hypothetical protein
MLTRRELFVGRTDEERKRIPVVILVTIETAVLALMATLVVGLLRSHAEILRRLESIAPSGADDAHSAAGGGATARVDPHLPPARAQVTPAFDVVGTTLDGDAVKLTVATGRPGGTVLAFLSSGCSTCRSFWDELREGGAALPGDPRLVVVTKDSAFESPSRLRELAPAGTPVIMSSRAWDDYGIAGSPYFVHAGPRGEVEGEGTAGSWAQVASLLRDAIEDARGSNGRGGANGAMGPAERLRRAEDELATAGIGPGHPSLYGGHPERFGMTTPDGA